MRSSRLTIFMILGAAIVAFLAGQRFGRETGLEVQLREPLLDAGPRLERALTIPDGAERTAQLLEILAELGPGDLKEVDAIFERRMPFIDPIAVVLFAEWWTSFDPEAAFEASARWPLNDPNLGLNAVMRAWARRDPVRARLSFEGITQMTRRDAAIRALAQGWSEYGDEQGLTKYLKSIFPVFSNK